MEKLNQFIDTLGSWAWGPVMIIFLVGAGIWLSWGTRLVQFRKMGTAFKLLFQGTKQQGEGDIPPFQSLMTAMAATIGTGNIAGVATAIVSGGPGAVFWMWITAAVGGATKFGEALLALKYRVTNEKGEKSGGPMYYIENGLKEKYGGNWKWLGSLFALFGVVASFGIGNMVQSNSMAESLSTSLGIPHIATGIIGAILIGFVIIGGIKSIGKVVGSLVPFMAVVYILSAIVILVLNASMIPHAFSMIFENAFTGKAVGGGLLGTVIRYGVARGVFSNEAGLGSAPIAHAASQNNDPKTQGLIGSLDSFIDTIIICTMTALAILTSGLITISPETGIMAVEGGLTGAALTTTAFGEALGRFGTSIIAVGLSLFAFSTILGWFYYGSKCIEYIGGVKITNIYKALWLILIVVGAYVGSFGGETNAGIDMIWSLSDAFNGLMALPNLIALILLSPLVFAMSKNLDKE